MLAIEHLYRDREIHRHLDRQNISLSAQAAFEVLTGECNKQRFLISRDFGRGNIDKWASELHLKYGDVVRIMPSDQSLVDPTVWSSARMLRPWMPKLDKWTMINVIGVKNIFTVLKGWKTKRDTTHSD